VRSESIVSSEVTALIQAADHGDSAAQQALYDRVYAELKQIARRQLAGSEPATLNTTGLVHETYLKLAQHAGPPLQGHVHFFALAAKAMRQIVIDRARARLTEKRGGEHLQVVELDAAVHIMDSQDGPGELLHLDRALELLEAEEPRLAQLVELRFFAGLEISEISALQQVSERTLNRDWRRAKAHLYATLHPKP
jgi:RNA polymerase sigma factor (TIGR02999 family)